MGLIDTLLKGVRHFQAQGRLYLATMLLWFVLLIVAAFNRRRSHHAVVVILFFLYNVLLLGSSLITDEGAQGASVLAPK